MRCKQRWPWRTSCFSRVSFKCNDVCKIKIEWTSVYILCVRIFVYTSSHTHKQISRRLQIRRELLLKQAATVLRFTFICFSLPVIMFQNNTVTLGNAQLCRMHNHGSWASELCRAATQGILRRCRICTGLFWDCTKHGKWYKQKNLETKVYCLSLMLCRCEGLEASARLKPLQQPRVRRCGRA